jgi:hypothetical protein
MTWINNITDAAWQEVNLRADSGDSVTLTLRYFDNQKGWFYSIAYGTFTLVNRRLIASPSLLRSFRRILPFGLACTTTDGQEPIFQDDFTSGRASIFLLSAADVQTMENSIVYGQISA